MADRARLLLWLKQCRDALTGLHKPTPTTKRRRNLDGPSPHHAVSIHAPSSACDAARVLGDQRFLSSEAPVLPLQDCDASECRCRYKHHEDRRVEPRRRDELGDTARIYTGSQRRVLADRRQDKEETSGQSYFDHVDKSTEK